MKTEECSKQTSEFNPYHRSHIAPTEDDDAVYLVWTKRVGVLCKPVVRPLTHTRSWRQYGSSVFLGQVEPYWADKNVRWAQFTCPSTERPHSKGGHYCRHWISTSAAHIFAHIPMIEAVLQVNIEHQQMHPRRCCPWENSWQIWAIQ